MHSVVARQVVQACGHKVVKQLPVQFVYAYVVPPAVFIKGSGAGAINATPQPQPQAVVHRAVRKRVAFRRLKALCASAAHALPLRGVRSVLVFGAQQLSSLAAFSAVSGVAIGGLALGVASKGIRRWHAARRSARRPLVTVNMGPATEVSIVTFNIRGIMDRWPERAPVLQRCLKQADADVVCFQEVLTGEFGQELLLLGSDYQVHECRAALHHLRSTSLMGAAYASAVRALLRLSWPRSLLVSLPESIEGWRERHQLSGNWSRLLRDLAIAPFYGNSIASRLPAVHPKEGQQQQQQHSSSSAFRGLCTTSMADCWGSSSSSNGSAGGDLLVLGDFRAAQRVCLQLKLSGSPAAAPQQQQQQQQLPTAAAAADDSSSVAGNGAISSSSSGEVAYVWLVNTHLDHAEPSIRSRQMEAICSWMEPVKASCAGIIVTGDLNAPPGEEVHAIMGQHGFVSAHKVAHGVEPSHTWPSGLQAPLMDEGVPHCADYIYAWQAPAYQLAVAAAQLCGHKPTAEDATLFPSDHIGLAVKLRVVGLGGSSSAGVGRVGSGVGRVGSGGGSSAAKESSTTSGSSSSWLN